MDNNNGHRIFVPLNGPTNIYMSGDVDNDASNGLQCGSDFRVTDANGTDKNGARLLVPCDNADITNVCYTVFATPLGTPGVPFLKFSSERGPQGDRYESWFWLDPDKVEPGEIKGTTTRTSPNYRCRLRDQCCQSKLSLRPLLATPISVAPRRTAG
jgi:hypothetical protein